jgi:hypothetical protein
MHTGLRVVPFVLALGLGSGANAACTNIDQTHSRWTDVLARSVDQGWVDYTRLQRDGQPALDAYLASLSGTCASDYERWTRAERIAFWINAYNAFTVRLILEHYPIASIRKIGWLPLAAFRQRFIPMEGLKGRFISLNDIENGTLRSAFHEPRIHFALVCGARSCPPLRSEAYRGVDLDHQLDDQGRTFLRDPTKNRLDAATKTLYLSSIFKWFRDDFEEEAGSLETFVSRYLGEDEMLPADPRVEFLDYDWRLNDRAATP